MHCGPRHRHGYRAGLKPVVEIQFFDYIWPAMMQIRDELTMLRWRSNNAFACPVVIRVPIGGYLAGGRCLSQPVGRIDFYPPAGLARGDAVHRRSMPTACCARRFAATTRCCFSNPSTSTARRTTARPTPGRDYMIPFGKAKLVREGTSLTIVTYGSLVVRAVQAAKTLEQDGIQAGDSGSALAESLRLGPDRRVGEKDQPRAGSSRRSVFPGAMARRLRPASPMSSLPFSMRLSAGSRARTFSFPIIPPRKTPCFPNPLTSWRRQERWRRIEGLL